MLRLLDNSKRSIFCYLFILITPFFGSVRDLNAQPVGEAAIEILKQRAPEFLNLIGEDALRTDIGGQRDPNGRKALEAALAKMPEKDRQKIQEIFRQVSAMKTGAVRATPVPEKQLLGRAELGKGVEFPNPEKLSESLAKEKSTHTISRKSLGKNERDTVKALAEIANQKPTTLPSCPRSVTNKIKLKGAKSSEKIVKDLLFVRFPLPSNAQEIFGDHVRAVRVTNDERDIVSKAALRIGVPCLPFRMRLTESNSYQHYGIDALKNYDSKSGETSLNPYVKEREDALLQ